MSRRRDFDGQVGEGRRRNRPRQGKPLQRRRLGELCRLGHALTRLAAVYSLRPVRPRPACLATPCFALPAICSDSFSARASSRVLVLCW